MAFFSSCCCNNALARSAPRACERLVETANKSTRFLPDSTTEIRKTRSNRSDSSNFAGRAASARAPAGRPAIVGVEPQRLLGDVAGVEMAEHPVAAARADGARASAPAWQNSRTSAAASAASSPAGKRKPVMRLSGTAGGASTTSGPAARSETITGRAIACASRIARCRPSGWTAAEHHDGGGRIGRRHVGDRRRPCGSRPWCRSPAPGPTVRRCSGCGRGPRRRRRRGNPSGPCP